MAANFEFTGRLLQENMGLKRQKCIAPIFHRMHFKYGITKPLFYPILNARMRENPMVARL